MPFSEIIEKSFKYPWKNRALWFYGFLLALFSGGANLGSNLIPDEKSAKFIDEKIANFSWSESTVVFAIIIFSLVVLVLMVISIIVSSWSQAAINRGVEQIEKKQKIDRKEIGKTGKRTIWNLIKLTLFIPLAIVFLTMILVIGAVALFAILPQPFGLYAGIVSLVFFILFLIVAAVYLLVIWVQAIRFVTNDSQKALDSLKMSRSLIKGHFWITLGFNIVIGMISSMGVFIAMLPLIIFGVIFIAFLVAKTYILAIIFGILTLLCLIPLLIAEGYLQAFLNTGHTLWWLALKKLKYNK